MVGFNTIQISLHDRYLNVFSIQMFGTGLVRYSKSKKLPCCQKCTQYLSFICFGHRFGFTIPTRYFSAPEYQTRKSEVFSYQAFGNACSNLQFSLRT